MHTPRLIYVRNKMNQYQVRLLCGIISRNVSSVIASKTANSKVLQCATEHTSPQTRPHSSLTNRIAANYLTNNIMQLAVSIKFIVETVLTHWKLPNDNTNNTAAICSACSTQNIWKPYFSVAGPTVWNSLPDNLWDAAVGCKHCWWDLKTRLFTGHWVLAH